VYRTPQTTTGDLAFTLVRTDIAGFAGFAERGPLPEDFPAETFDAAQAALKITSWKEFQTNFGGLLRYGYLAYAVRGFFENGGDTCYVARVAAMTAADPAQRPAAAFFTFPAGKASQLGVVGPVASAFQAAFQAKGGSPVAGDLVRLDGTAGSGFSQINQVAALLDKGLQFARKLDAKMPVNTTLARFPAAFTIRARSRGNWGNRVQIQVAPLDNGAFALRVYTDLGPDNLPGEVEFYRRLTLANKDAVDYAGTVLQQSNLIRMDTIRAGFDLTTDVSFASGQFYLQGGRDGVAQVALRDFAGGLDDLRGLRLLEEIDDIAMLAIPDAVYRGVTAPAMNPAPPDPCAPKPVPPPETVAEDPTAVPTPLQPGESLQLQQKMIDQCQRLRYRVALMDPPDGIQVKTMPGWPMANQLVTRSSQFAAIYYPWLKVPDPLEVDGEPSRRVPPSGSVAGAYAHTDLNFGVQKPPANVELISATDLGESISDAEQGALNDHSVNAIRAFPGRGIRVWGARSLASALDPDWKFIHVRRLMSAIEETLQRYSRWVVFRNNDATLRLSLKHSLEVMLHGIWAKGGLKGGTLAQAFFVKCDETNNPQAVIDQGQLICQVGVAVVAPMEFIVFEIRQEAEGAQVVEN
jgi:uncharacterized protein